MPSLGFGGEVAADVLGDEKAEQIETRQVSLSATPERSCLATCPAASDAASGVDNERLSSAEEALRGQRRQKSKTSGRTLLVAAMAHSVFARSCALKSSTFTAAAPHSESKASGQTQLSRPRPKACWRPLAL